MSREDIIRMAEECGIPEFENNESQADNILRFATLVAEQDTALLRQSYLLCDEINKMPHVRGSINGMAVQLQYALSERLGEKA
jgi:hypothetical protein